MIEWIFQLVESAPMGSLRDYSGDALNRIVECNRRNRLQRCVSRLYDRVYTMAKHRRLQDAMEAMLVELEARNRRQ